MVWNQRNTQWFNRRFFNNLLGNHSWRSLSIGDCRTSSRDHRNNRHHRNHPTGYFYYLLVGLLAVNPVYAEEPTVKNTSSPVAAATGNVTNQAIQFQNTGAPSRQMFATNNSCNGTTLTASPFYTGGDVHTDTYQRTGNFGMSVNVSVPLDGGMVELCKSIARRHEQKMRLDYELVRALKCAELGKAGFMFRPESPYAKLCHDVVPIVAYEKESNRRAVQRATQLGDW